MTWILTSTRIRIRIVTHFAHPSGGITIRAVLDISGKSAQPIEPDDNGLRLGIITHSLPFDSTEAFFYPELKILTELGCKLTVFPAAARSNQRIHRDFEVDFVKFSLLGPKTLFRALRGLRRNVQATWRALVTIIRSKNRLGIKLKNFVLFPTGLAVADEACVRGLKHLHAYWLTGPATVGFIASQVAGISWSYSAITHDIFVQNNLISEKMRSASFGRVISERGWRELVFHSKSSARGPLEIIHLGVEAPAQQRGRAPAPRSPRGAIRLLCAAYFIPVKGHAYLIEALRGVVDAGVSVHCVLAGDGFLLNAVARKVRKLQLESNVTMLGMIPHTKLLQQLHSGSYDAVVLASVELGTEFEGIPMSLMEAMAARIPCIATRTGSIGELIDPRCGILVDQCDPAALRDAIILLAFDPALRQELGQQARRKIEEHFNADTSARSLKNLIESEFRTAQQGLPATHELAAFVSKIDATVTKQDRFSTTR